MSKSSFSRGVRDRSVSYTLDDQLSAETRGRLNGSSVVASGDQSVEGKKLQDYYESKIMNAWKYYSKAMYEMDKHQVGVPHGDFIEYADSMIFEEIVERACKSSSKTPRASIRAAVRGMIPVDFRNNKMEIARVMYSQHLEEMYKNKPSHEDR